MNTVWKFLQAPVFDDEEKTRRAALLHVILLTQVGVLLLALVGTLSSFLTTGNVSAFEVIVMVIGLSLVALWEFLMRRGQVVIASLGMLIFFILSVSLILFDGGTIRSTGLIFLPLVIVMAMLLLGRRAGIIFTILTVAIGVVLIMGEMQGFLPVPSNQTTGSSFAILIGGMALSAVLLFLASRDIDRLLLSALQSEKAMRLQAASLEQRVAERTAVMEQTNLYLALATEIGQNVAQVRELNSMLRDAAEIIRAFFGLYYVQVYLVNPTETELVLQFGTGDVGVELLSRHHRLPLDTNSINGRAAISKRSVVIADTAATPTFRPNPLLPNTRSEMAVPLLVGDQLIGVLDMQSEQVGMLSEAALIAFEPLSGQLAVAIQNARLVTETERARAELESLTHRLTRSGWDNYLDAIHKPEITAFQYEANQVTPFAVAEAQASIAESALSADIAIGNERLGSLVVELGPSTPSTRAAELLSDVSRLVAQQIENLRLLESAERYRGEAEQAMRRLTRQGWEAAQSQIMQSGYLYRDFKVQPLTETVTTESTRTFPITVRNEAIGEIAIAGAGELSEQDEELLASVRQQLAAHLENLRLAQETQNALTQTEAIYAASALVVQATSVGEVLRAVVENTPLRQFERASIMLFNRPWADAMPETGILAAEWERSGQQPAMPVGATFPLASMPTTRQARRDRPTYVQVTPDMPGLTTEEYELVKQIGINSVTLPIVAGEQWIGWLSVASNDEVDLSEGDLRQIGTLTGQAATVIQSIRLLDEATARARREQSLRQIATRVRTFVEPDMILRTAARELGDALGRKVTIQLGSVQPSQPADSVAQTDTMQEKNHE